MAKVAASIAHHLPQHGAHLSRTRIKVPREAIENVLRHLERHPKVKSVDGNPTTGSVLVHHQGSLDDLIAEMEAAGICEMAGLPDSASDILAALGPRVLTLGLVAAVVAVGGLRWLR
jgi:hypothetical protein